MESDANPKKYSREASIPFGMHRRIMRRLFFEKYGHFIFGVMALSLFSVGVSGWYALGMLIEKGTMDIILDFYGELGSSSDFLSEAWGFILSDLSWILLAVLIGSALLFSALFLSYVSMVFRTVLRYK